ncbi:MAG TPA: hypothetical protein VIJ36_10220 [Thermoanaerobaculia bacterium]
MKKTGIATILMLILTLTLGAAGAWAADHTITVLNASKGPVTVAILWSGGGVAPVKLEAGETHDATVPADMASVKVTADGHCRQGVQTFNPQRVNRATVQCKGDSYTIKVEQVTPAPAP